MNIHKSLFIIAFIMGWGAADTACAQSGDVWAPAGIFGNPSGSRKSQSGRSRSNAGKSRNTANLTNVRLGIGRPKIGERVIDVTFACSDGDLQTVTVYARSKATQSMIVKKALEGVNPFVRATEIVSIKDAGGIIYYDR